MAAPRELNARERKRVYMHSTIFDAGGPTSKSVYSQNQQNEIAQGLCESLKLRQPPSMSIPSPADIQCTQNAGHGVVIPSNVGVDRRGNAPASPANVGSTPRISNPEFLVTDGNPMPVTKANNKDVAIPQEFWQTSVNLQWHDPRNEISRLNKNRNKEMGAQELKLQEMSSEIFGKARLTNCSTNKPQEDLLSSEADYLQVDSALNPNLRQARSNQEVQSTSAYDRFASNLTGSNQNTLAGKEQAFPVPMPQEEDPVGAPRRRQEKNFSDLFGTQMGERRDIRAREEVTGTRTCSFLDTRSEIATRNKEHWRVGQSDVEGADIKEQPRVSKARQEAQLVSNMFDRVPPQKPAADPGTTQVNGDERVCWDTREIMQFQSEIARRSRTKDFEAEQTAPERKFNTLASQQVRRGIGGQYDEAQPQFSPRGDTKHSHRFSDPRPLGNSVAGGYPTQRPSTAKDTKLASLQSSIFN